MMRTLKSLLNGILCALTPSSLHCPVCGGYPPMGVEICPTCLDTLPKLPDEHCVICADESKTLICPKCHDHLPAFDGALAPLSYDGAVPRLVHHIKYQSRTALVDEMLDLMQSASGDFDVDVITPVPMHPVKLRQRGYNQAEVLSKALSRRLGYPIKPLLICTRYRRSQTRLDRLLRSKNAENAFRALNASGLRILLIDDVLTTGATVNACAKALKDQGAEKVYVLALARALRKG